MVRRALLVLCLSVFVLFMASCGQTYKLQSITVSPDVGFNLEGLGKSEPLVVTAHYSNTKTEDVTAKSTYTVSPSADSNAPLNGIGVSSSGVVQASSAIGVCTWTAAPTNATGTTFAYGTSPYLVTVSYGGFSTTVQISVASMAGCYDGQSYIPPNGYGV